MKELAEKENELQRLYILQAEELEAKNQMETELEELKKAIPGMNQRYIDTVENAKYSEKLSRKDFKTAYDSISDIITEEALMNGSKKLANAIVLGFSIHVPDDQDEKKPNLLIERNNQQYMIKMGTSTSGNARRVINQLKKFSETAEEIQGELLQAENRKKELKAQVDRSSNQYSDSIKQLEDEIQIIHHRLKRDE